ncbi:signal transducer and activator of transcription 6 isoform X2 [Kryptolebias marmoratus]|uniref:signal transducer and activator of transcription 6 isoform X2 n=1 Tax=Kryptolebias marmoratus TaxID=37003 RepID=UPI0007F87F28|nr:signal transducer and activator of transcription 6 isoform X2 [Kryptolebias marmoratus]
MACWVPIEKILEHASVQTQNLYPIHTFPIEVRYYLRDWIQIQRWDEFAPEKVELECQAQALLNHVINSLQELAQRTENVMEKMKLIQISRNMANHQPLQFAVMVRDILMQEKVLMEANNCPQYQVFPQSDPNSEDVGKLKEKVRELQEIRKRMHHMQEELNWDKQNIENLSGSYQQNGMEYKTPDVQKLYNSIQKLGESICDESTKRCQLLKNCVDHLEHSQTQFISRLKAWKWEQHKAAIGHPFDENLTPLQTCCEHLLGVNWDLRQELMLTGEHIPDIQERLGKLLQVLIESSVVVEKQPPQVIKTQSKFSTTVRYLLGEKIAPGKPMMVKAQIINEQQARNLGSISSENVGEVINNSAVLEHNTTTRSTCATFRNMSIKKIKRADRKGSESVTEEKFALLFSTDIIITGCDTSFRIQVISQPVVVIVHGSQDNNALATIIWDCAFAEPDRRPFVVPESVPWRLMSNTLNMKFTSEVQTQHQLHNYNKIFLAGKIFDKSDSPEGFDNMMVSWAQFNKEVLPGRPFTFWQWFEGAMELTKKHLRTYWSEGLIFGFIGKQHLHFILRDSPNGTFLLRFSDSEIGGITIAYVCASENGGRQVQNIQPFTKRDLEIRCLGDRIRDINEITHLYPNYPKHDVFKKHYSGPQQPVTSGYIPVSLQTKVGMESTLPTANMGHPNSTPTGFIGDAISPTNIATIDPIPMDSTLSSDNTSNFPEGAISSSTLQDLTLEEISPQHMHSFPQIFDPLDISSDGKHPGETPVMDYDIFDALNC